MKRTKVSTMIIFTVLLVLICGFTVLAGTDVDVAVYEMPFSLFMPLQGGYASTDNVQAKSIGATAATVTITECNNSSGNTQMLLRKYNDETSLVSSIREIPNAARGSFSLSYLSEYINDNPTIRLYMRSASGQTGYTISGKWSAN